MDKKLKVSIWKLLNDQWQWTDYRKQDYWVVGTTAYAEQMVSVVISCEKNAMFIKHVSHAKLVEEINNGLQSNY